MERSAGKKRRRHIQQPKPVQKYDLDVAAFEFSSTQKMHDDEPLQSEAPSLLADAAHPAFPASSLFTRHDH